MKPVTDKLYLFIKIFFAGLILFSLLVFLCLIVQSPIAGHAQYGVTETERIAGLSMGRLVFVFSLLIIAFMAIIIGFILRVFRKMKTPIMVLGTGVLFTAVWLIFDSGYFYNAFLLDSVDGVMSFLMILLVPFPFIFYLEVLQENRYRKLYVILTLLLEVSALVCILLHFTKVADYSSLKYVIALIEGVVISGVVFAMVQDFRDGSYRKYLLSYIGVGGLAVSCAIELISRVLTQDSRVGTFIIVGLFWTVMLGILHQLFAVREAQEKAAMAVRASETKTNFLANMSHEIRTPMNAILGMDEMILREAKNNPRILKYAQDIKSAGNMLLSIINGILDLSKIESGKAELVENDFDIRPVINDLVNIVKKRAEDKNLNFSFDVASGIPVKLCGDETRIRQVMLNIINNAVKYTNDGFVEVMLNADIDGMPEGRTKLILTVKDTGIGIREEDVEKLFQPFDRLEQTKNRNIEGTGLGLSIAYTYVKLMGGDINVKSVYGEGSVFTVFMPVSVVDGAPIGDISRTINIIREAGEEEETYIMAPGARVLVIDDNEMNLEVISGLLERSRMRVDLAQSGADGISMMKKRRYDIILLDQMMPGMDGISTLKQMNTEFDMQGIPVIALTADAVMGAREYYLENGFTDYLSKPVKPAALENALAQYLPQKLVLYREIDSGMETTRVVGTPAEAPKTMLVVDHDRDSLKQIKEKTARIYRGTFVADMEKARKYLDGHDVDYVFVSREVFEELLDKDDLS